MFAFIVVWIGQAISLLGTNMTGFAMTIWAYEKTGSATALALVGFFFVTPMLIISPLAGAIVDRSNRKFMMMISDLASGITTIAILVLYASGKLEVWHLYITGAIQGTFQTFQWPAYSAAITMMVPKEQYGRANGLTQLAEAGSGIFAPILAGALLALINVTGILTIDIITFIIAIGALLLVHIPQPTVTEAGKKGQGSLWKESLYGFKYIFHRPSLLGLQLVFLTGNFATSIAFTVFAPMVLASTNNNEIVFGSVQSVGAIGGVLGGLAISAWGGPKRKVHGVLGGWALTGLLGVLLLGFGRRFIPLWAVGLFAGTFLAQIINASNQSIWQLKVAPDVQGRVFSVRRLIAWFVNPLGTLLAGPLADLAFEPAMKDNGILTGLFGRVVGIGPGAGMSLMYVLIGLFVILVGLAGYAFPAVRNAEDILPDHDSAPAAADNRLARAQELLEKRQEWITRPATPERDLALKEITRELRELGRSQAHSPIDA